MDKPVMTPKFQKNYFFVILVLSLFSSVALSQSTVPASDNIKGYHKAPSPIPEILSAPPTPLVLVSPKSDRLLVADRLAYPPISDLSQPMLRLAGLRLNPATNGRHHPPRFVGLHVVNMQDGKEHKIAMPADAYLSAPEWSGDNQHFAFTNTTPTGIELWVGDAAAANAHRIGNFKVNAAYPYCLQWAPDGRVLRGNCVQWMPDGKTLLVESVPEKRGTVPADLKVPEGPVIQESDGKRAPVRTYEDLLENAHDEDLFDYYTTSQLLLIDIRSGLATPVGKPGIFETVEPSPDGNHFLVAQVHRPYSYLLPASEFPKEVEVWDKTGKLEHKLASLPLAEHVPIEGVLTGPREYEWIPTEPATLVWAEALDGGDPKAKADFRDRLLMLKSPFQGQPGELARLQQRFVSMSWGEKEIALARDYDRNRRWVRTFLLNANQPGEQPRLLWERSIRERYKDPGTLLMRTLPNGKRILWQNGDSIFLSGPGGSPKGDFPFLDRFDLQSLKADRLFQCSGENYEQPVALASEDGSRFITRYESVTEPPNYFVRTPGNSNKTALTHFPDPAPQLRGITKQIVSYKRNDGVQLSFTLYLPPNYKQGDRLPTIVWAYPLEYNDADTAGQISGSPYRFTTITGISHLFLLTQGYAILDNATMPVVGDPETMNNTYVEQIVASAKAAIEKAVDMGVTDPNRVGVGGHSYGAFMTANLLAHSDLFRAGVARSGAYNRTLTPFGFQSERRTLWEAPEMYMKVSPFMHADKIRHPILLIHGQADDNSGTFPIQSERMYQAIKGNGGIVRYVTLPYEAHAYLARESVEHTLYEMVIWFDRWVKNAPPAQEKKTAQVNGPSE
jgi:dipeptidyl aminopeptidase/acylaminoacyl peptidase